MEILMGTQLLFYFCFNWYSGYAFSTFLPNNAESGKEDYTILTTHSIAINEEKNFRYESTLNAKLQSEKEIFLRVTSPMKNQNATSGDDVLFKCKIAGWPRQNIHYTWYHNEIKIHPRRFKQHTITTHDWGSKLRVKAVYTFNSGSYRCEASNGLRRVETSAKLEVLFHRPPPRGKKEMDDMVFSQGRCQLYEGAVCKEYLDQKNIFVDIDANPAEIERHIKSALNEISRSEFVTGRCRSFAFPAFCYHVFPPCHVTDAGARAQQLCQEECELLKRDVCHDEYLNKDNHQLMKYIFENANCSKFPSMTDGKCAGVGLYSQNQQKAPHNPSDCFNKRGQDYRGNIGITESGMKCKKWPNDMVEKDPDLKNHRFCRNPDNTERKPWCFIDDVGSERALCDVPHCAIHRSSVNFFLAILCACAILLIIGLILTYIRCLRRSKKADTVTPSYSTISHRRSSLFLLPQVQLPQVNASSVRVLAEIGVGSYGKAYTGSVIGNARFSPEQTIALKILRKDCCSSEQESFYSEVKSLSELNHSNITTVKAIVFQTSLRCLIFEYTEQVNLLEHLLLSGSNCAARKKSSSSSNDHSHIDNLDLIEMCLQIASGMEYLSSNNYIHRDLAARNVLVCGNMDLKISNLGVVKDSYLSCYYKSPQGNLVPLRWMAPESLESWQFSHPSTVWSFGILLWEMFSYGMHPYCGYSNHEVLEMILRRQLLPCPLYCPAPVFTVIQNCWSPEPNKRPKFENIRAKLQSWMEAGDVIIVTRQQRERELDEDLNDFPPPPKYSSLPSNSSNLQQGNCSKSEASYPSFVFNPNLNPNQSSQFVLSSSNSSSNKFYSSSNRSKQNSRDTSSLSFVYDDED